MTITSNDSLWTSVTSHQAQAHPPTTVFLLVDPQQPPERNSLEKSWCINLQIIRKGWTDNHEMCIGQWRIHIVQGIQKIIFNLFNWQGFCRKMKYAGCSSVLLRLDERSLHFWSMAKKVVRCTWRAGCQAPCCQLLITLFRTLGNIQQAHCLARPSLDSHLKNIFNWWFKTLNYLSQFIKSRKAIESGFDWTTANL